MGRLARVRPVVVLALVVLTTLATFVVYPGVASAHSALESTTPAAGEVVAEAPSVITLQFNEPVSVPEGGIRLLDIDGDGVDVDEAGVEDSTVSVEVPDELADGSYIVSWKVMSADSHPVTGAFTFAVGAPSVASDGSDPLAVAAEVGSTGGGAQAAVDVANALAYGGVLVAAGAALFVALVLAGAAVARLVTRSALVGAVGLVLGVVASAARVAGGWPSWPAVVDEMFGASGAQAAVGGSGLVMVVAAVRAGGLPPIVRKLLLIDGAAAALGAFVIVGHTRTASPIALTVVADLAHLAAAAVWTGGLAALLVALRPAGAVGADDADADAVGDDARLVARFSTLAGGAIVVVAVAGAVLGWRIVGSWEALTSTTYGVLLAVKVGLFAVVASIGGYNRFRLVGRVDAGNGRVVLRRTLVAEVAVIAAIVAVTASFTSISPEVAPATPETTPLSCAEVQEMESMPGMENMDHTCVGTTTTAVPFDPTIGSGGSADGTVRATAAFGDGLAVIAVTPAKVGAATVKISLTDATGTPLDPRDAPTVQFRLRSEEIGPISQTATRTGPGAYRVDQQFVLPGTWEINVSAVVTDFEQPQAVVKVTVAE